MIGNFDGVHRGHQSLAVAARRLAAGGGRTGGGVTGGRVTALVFDPHPLTLIRPEAAPARLSTLADRSGWLQEAGVDDVAVMAPDRAMLDLSPEEFVRWLVETHRPTAVVEGEDFCFGKGRSGNVATLCSLAKASGFGVEVMPATMAVLDDHSEVKVSSSLTRWLLSNRRVADVARMLGRPYCVPGTVVRGDRRGRTIGFPTANLQTDVMLPGDGVYAARAVLADGREFAAAVNVGARPTFAGAARTVEAHLIGEHGLREWAPIAGLDEYGWTLRLEMAGFIRDQVKFDGLAALTGQLARDCKRAVEMVAVRQEVRRVGKEVESA